MLEEETTAEALAVIHHLMRMVMEGWKSQLESGFLDEDDWYVMVRKLVAMTEYARTAAKIASSLHIATHDGEFAS